MNTRERRPTSERRDEIADAALRIIGTRGIAALSTSTLAHEVGLTTGALFRHFPSRDAILDEVARRVERLFDATFAVEGSTPVERLERFVAARASLAGGHAGLLRLMHSEQFALALPRTAARRLRTAVARTRAFVAATIAAGQAAGELRDDVPAAALAVVVLGAMQALAVSSANGAQAASLRDALRVLLAPPAHQPHKSRARRGRRA